MKRKCIATFTACSATGKSAIQAALEEKKVGKQVYSVTTRTRRSPNDKRIFVSDLEFEAMKNHLVECVTYGPFKYGISRVAIENTLATESCAMLDANESGVRDILRYGKETETEVVTIFLTCSAQELYARQMTRVGDGITLEDRVFRLRNSLNEIESLESGLYQFTVNNGDGNFDTAVSKIERILSGDSSVESDPFDLDGFRKDLVKILSTLEENVGDTHVHG